MEPIKQVIGEKIVIVGGNVNGDVNIGPGSKYHLVVILAFAVISLIISLSIYLLLYFQPAPFWNSDHHSQALAAVNATRALTATFYDSSGVRDEKALEGEIVNSIGTLSGIVSNLSLSEEDQLLVYQAHASATAMHIQLMLGVESYVEESRFEKREELEKRVMLCKNSVRCARDLFCNTNGRFRSHLQNLAEEKDEYQGSISGYLSEANCIAFAAESLVHPDKKISAKSIIEAEIADPKLASFWGRKKQFPNLIMHTLEK